MTTILAPLLCLSLGFAFGWMSCEMFSWRASKSECESYPREVSIQQGKLEKIKGAVDEFKNWKAGVK